MLSFLNCHAGHENLAFNNKFPGKSPTFEVSSKLWELQSQEQYSWSEIRLNHKFLI
jgi:hypothetical protein